MEDMEGDVSLAEGQAIEGRAEIRGRAVWVRWHDGVIDGDPELRERLRQSGEHPDTAVGFLRALRTVGGTTERVSIAPPRAG
jgi:hypothetical protein